MGAEGEMRVGGGGVGRGGESMWVAFGAERESVGGRGRGRVREGWRQREGGMEAERERERDGGRERERDGGTERELGRWRHRERWRDREKEREREWEGGAGGKERER